MIKMKKRFKKNKMIDVNTLCYKYPNGMVEQLVTIDIKLVDNELVNALINTYMEIYPNDFERDNFFIEKETISMNEFMRRTGKNPISIDMSAM